ncbi:alpha/beta hydrolase family protein [Micromonospora echinofusca]|uniref:alpha/beta hydrolase family protein n=1 Tax=Micromonospora echinofusca TaxID=47858 RepID=UPI0027DD076E|nr:alpha/beta hydrolase [Micromonospora echinofusca]
MDGRRLVTGVVVGLLSVVLGAWGPTAAVAPEGTAGASAVTAAPAGSPDGRPVTVSTADHPVGVRTLDVPVHRHRLAVTVWYPARHDGPGAPVAPGRFPVVLYSHGLHSLPVHHTALTSRWAAAGFVVVAPTYPRTSQTAAGFTRADVRHQPGYAWQVLRHLRRLDPADPLAGHLDPRRVAAAGHSAGGFTTSGMFTVGHPAWLRAGIVIAGGGLPGSYAGPAAHLLFVHGDADPVVPVAVGRAAFARARWPRAFLTVTGQGHGEYLAPGRPGFDQVVAVTTDFLRWRLRDDRAARDRIPGTAYRPGVSGFVRHW